MSDQNQLASSLRLHLRAWSTLAAIVAGFAIYNVLTHIIVEHADHHGPSLVVFAFIGGGISQAVLLGLWAVLGPGLARVRLPLTAAAALLAVCASAAPAFWRAATHSAQPGEIAGVIGGMALSVFAAAMLLGEILRRITQQSIRSTLEMHVAGTAKSYQFSTRYLLGLTTLCALLLAVVSPFLRTMSWPEEPFVFVLLQLAMGSAVIFALCLPTIVIPWAILTLQPREILLTVGAFFWMLWTTVVIAVFAAFEGPPSEAWGHLLAVQFGAALVGAASAIVLHFADFRLVPDEGPIPRQPNLSPAPQSSL